MYIQRVNALILARANEPKNQIFERRSKHEISSTTSDDQKNL
jgi:hypothetical protein